MMKVIMNKIQDINDVQNVFVDQVQLQQMIHWINQMRIIIFDQHVEEYE